MISAEDARLNTMKKLQQEREFHQSLIIDVTNSIVEWFDKNDAIDFASKSGEDHITIFFIGRETCVVCLEVTLDNKRTKVYKNIEIRTLPRKRRVEVINALTNIFRENKYSVVHIGWKKDSCVVSW